MKESKPKILFIDQFNKVGGGQTVLVNSIKSLASSYGCSLLIPRGTYLQKCVSQEVSDITLYKEVKLHPRKKNAFDLIKYGLFILKFFGFAPLFRKSDMIYVNGARLFLPSFLVANFFSKKLIYHIHLDHSKLEK